jgi:hypothetical protein
LWQQRNGLKRESSHDHLDGEKKEEEPVAPLLASWRKFFRFKELSWGAAGTSVAAFLGEWEDRLPLLAFKLLRRLHHQSEDGNCFWSWKLFWKPAMKAGFRIRIDLMRIRIRIRIQHFF